KVSDGHKAYFAAIGQSAIKIPEVELDSNSLNTSSTFAKRFAVDHEKLQHNFKSAQNNVMLLLQSGNNYDNLYATYIKFALIPETNFVDMDKLSNASKKPSNTIDAPNAEWLINLVAEWMVTHTAKQVEQFFEHFEL